MTRWELISLMGKAKVEELERYLFLHALKQADEEKRRPIWYEFMKVFKAYFEKHYGNHYEYWNEELDYIILNLKIPYNYPVANDRITEANINDLDNYDFFHLADRRIIDAISDMLDDCHN